MKISKFSCSADGYASAKYIHTGTDCTHKTNKHQQQVTVRAFVGFYFVWKNSFGLFCIFVV